MRARILYVTLMMFVAVIPLRAQEFGWIGVNIDDDRDRGAVIRRVEPNSPAEKAGLKDGDVILEFNKQEVIGVQQLTRIVRETPVGRTIDVKVRRDNREQTFKITTDRSPAFHSGRIELNLPDVNVWTDRVIRDLPRVQVNTVYVRNGVQVEQLTDQLRDFFGVFSNTGVLVTSVDRGSAAEKAGLKAGDVVISIDDRSIRNPGDFGREMRVDSKGVVKIIRDKKE